MKLKVALLQILPDVSPMRNFMKAKQYIIEAKTQAADIVLLPELWNVGYESPDKYGAGREEWGSAALGFKDAEFSIYQDLAKELDIAIVFPFLEKDELLNFYNSAAIIDRTGKVVLHYRKVHTVDWEFEGMLAEGVEFPVVELSIAKGEVKIGCMICYDREFPESARILMLNGAEIILVPNACAIETNRVAQLQTRGFENMVGIAMTNYPAPKLNGNSVAFDGMRVRGENYDPLIVRADESEGAWYAEFDLEKLRAYRSEQSWGDTYRRPDLYGKLVEDINQPPFVRKNAKRHFT